MSRRSGLWRVVAALFVLVNLVGVGYAVALGERPHAAVHAVLALFGVGLLWWLSPWAGRQGLASVRQTDARLERLQQSVDALAVEVERIGEAQRFIAKVQAERSAAER